jgi:DNA-binding CsgD family transcriptional regulator
MTERQRLSSLDARTWARIGECVEDAGSARNLKEFYARTVASIGHLVPHDVGAACFSFERGLPRWLDGTPTSAGKDFNEKYRYVFPINRWERARHQAIEDFARYEESEYVRDFLRPRGVQSVLSAFSGQFHLSVFRSQGEIAFSQGDSRTLMILCAQLNPLFCWIQKAERALRAAQARVAPAVPTRFLTRRELEVLACLERGLAAREIGIALDMSPRTAERHIANIYEKLGVKSRAELVAALAERGKASERPGEAGSAVRGEGQAAGRPAADRRWGNPSRALLRIPRDRLLG